MAVYLVGEHWRNARVFYNKTQTFPTDFQLPLFLHSSLLSVFSSAIRVQQRAPSYEVYENKCNMGCMSPLHPVLQFSAPEANLSGIQMSSGHSQLIAVGQPYWSNDPKARILLGCFFRGVFSWTMFSLGLYSHCKVTSENPFSVPLFFSLDHLVISILIKFRLIEEHSMLKPTFTFLLAVLPSNQERAVWAQFRGLIGSCSRVGNFRQIFHFNMICSWVPCLRVMCKPTV